MFLSNEPNKVQMKCGLIFWYSLNEEELPVFSTLDFRHHRAHQWNSAYYLVMLNPEPVLTDIVANQPSSPLCSWCLLFPRPAIVLRVCVWSFTVCLLSEWAIRKGAPTEEKNVYSSQWRVAAPSSLRACVCVCVLLLSWPLAKCFWLNLLLSCLWFSCNYIWQKMQ